MRASLEAAALEMEGLKCRWPRGVDSGASGSGAQERGLGSAGTAFGAGSRQAR